MCIYSAHQFVRKTYIQNSVRFTGQNIDIIIHSKIPDFSPDPLVGDGREGGKPSPRGWAGGRMPRPFPYTPAWGLSPSHPR